MGSKTPDAIPTIDISEFISPTSTEAQKQAVVDNVRHACTTYGFFQAVGHGVTVDEQKEILDCTRRFFALPEEDRMEVCVSKSMGKSLRGYEPPLIQTHHKGLMPDIKEVSQLRVVSKLWWLPQQFQGSYHHICLSRANLDIRLLSRRSW